ncbi:MAG: protein-L-isoaspartate O-methyltransferase [Gammaproteobacteria bacterium]|nr:protein-L-isoaspartate O-methyltransferase [Gammaproteobacteria bacterium]
MNIDFARQQMVEQQVRTCDVFDAGVLSVLASVPREQFVPAGFEALAFADTELPIGHNQYMMTPVVEGRVLQALAVQASDNVLEVGTGSGFLTACLARLAASVTSLDIYDDFLESAAANLADSGIGNFELLNLDATQALPDGTFDVIAVTGSIGVYDPRYAMALSPGGRLFVVVGAASPMEALLVRRQAETDWHTTSLFETHLPALVNGAQLPQFCF